MEFSESFPELKDRKAYPLKYRYYNPEYAKRIAEVVHGVDDFSNVFPKDVLECDVYPEIFVEKFCLSKSKVREKIDWLFRCNIIDQEVRDEIFKEWGLEDE